MFIWEYRFVFVVGIASVIYGLFEWEKAKAKLYALMLQAKRLSKEAVLSSGEEQEDWVVEKAYTMLPQFLKVFISKELIRQIIKWLYDQAKNYLDDGELSSSK